MNKLAFSLLVLGLLACGGQGGDDPTAQSAPSADGAAMSEPAPVSAGGSAQDCVDLVQAERFEEAVASCQSALEQDPTNSAARLALQRAQRGAQ